MDAFEKAVQEVTETGALSFSARRELWLAFGPWEERDERDQSPRPFTEPLIKRTQLALACAKKVRRVWALYDPNDKTPQKMIRETKVYLDGELTPGCLSLLYKISDSFMSVVEEERYSSAPMAALAAERAVAVALWDEFLLEPCYADADDTDLDPYDWDTAWCASLAWSGRDEGASGGQQKVENMKFWAWYLEQAAGLLGIEGFKFPKKAVKDFEEKQEMSRPVPEEVTLETFTQFLGAGEYRSHYHVSHSGSNRYAENLPTYDICTFCPQKEAVCPKCRTTSTQLKFYYGVNVLEAKLPGSDISIRLLHTLPLYQCPNCPDSSFTPGTERINPKAAMKRYLTGPGRVQTFQNELERRASNVFNIGEGYVSLNGAVEHHHNIKIPAGVQGIRWLDPEVEEVPLDMGKLGKTSYLTGMTEERLEVELRLFGPHVYFHNMKLEEFCCAYPETVERMEDGSLRLTMERHWVRCWLDKAGNLERVVIQSRFYLEVETEHPVTLTRFLMMEFHLSKDQAEAEVSAYCAKGYPRKEIGPFSDLTRAEALRLRAALRSKGIKCRIMPVPVGEKGDTQLR